MAQPVIKIENLCKQYRLGVIGHGYLIRDFQSWWARLRKTEDPNSVVDENFPHNPLSKQIIPDEQKDWSFWALKHINLDVPEGDVLGIIGRNGAGKSTLLKIISQVTAPTIGTVKIKGRVGSLLEVGTGFHPELTGRENIYLNGSILGMDRDEIRRKFDEIVVFAEVEKFLDTPVKRYSSGMIVRLAFAVAAHLDPEILLVDEVLAVGDSKFQQKCMGKIDAISTKEKRTILFVSHNMAIISSLCKRCVLLENGKIAAIGKTSDIILRYYNSYKSPGQVLFEDNDKAIGDDLVVLTEGAITNAKNEMINEIELSEELTVRMRFKVKYNSNNSFISNVYFYTADGYVAFAALDPEPRILLEGEYFSECSVPPYFLNDGTYFIGLGMTTSGKEIRNRFFEKNALSINVIDPIIGTPGRSGYGGPIPGAVRPVLNFNIRTV